VAEPVCAALPELVHVRLSVSDEVGEPAAWVRMLVLHAMGVLVAVSVLAAVRASVEAVDCKPEAEALGDGRAEKLPPSGGSCSLGGGLPAGMRRVLTEMRRRRSTAFCTPSAVASQLYSDSSAPLENKLFGTSDVTLAYSTQGALMAPSPTALMEARRSMTLANA